MPIARLWDTNLAELKSRSMAAFFADVTDVIEESEEKT